MINPEDQMEPEHHIETRLSPDHEELLTAVRDTLDKIERRRRDEPVGLSDECMEFARDVMDLPEKYYAHHVLAFVPELDVEVIIRELYATCPELVGSAGDHRVRWRVKHGSRSGKAVLGTCAVVSAKDRTLAKQEGLTVYQWEVTLALDAWMVMTPNERQRLVHHELMHCALSEEGEPKTRGHDVEDFGATLGRFGAAEWQVRPVALAMQHPETRQAVRTWEAGPDDAPLLGRWIAQH